MPPKKDKKVIFKKRRRGARGGAAGKKSSSKQKQKININITTSAGGSGGGFIPLPMDRPSAPQQITINPAATQPIGLAQSVIQPLPDIAVRNAEPPPLVETQLPKARRRIEGESDAEYSSRMAKYYQKLEEASARQIEQRRKAAMSDIPQAYMAAEAMPLFTESGMGGVFGLDPVSESERDVEKSQASAPPKKVRKPREKKAPEKVVAAFTSGGEE